MKNMQLKRDNIGSFFLQELRDRGNGIGRERNITNVLVCLFEEVGEKDLNLTFENCINDRYTGPASDYFGAAFQKTFRQTDVTKSRHIDSAIWHCISASSDFWETMTEVFEYLDATKNREPSKAPLVPIEPSN